MHDYLCDEDAAQSDGQAYQDVGVLLKATAQRDASRINMNVLAGLLTQQIKDLLEIKTYGNTIAYSTLAKALEHVEDYSARMSQIAIIPPAYEIAA